MAANATSATLDGTIEQIDGRYVLRFDRRIDHPVERVWDALTTPEQVSQWYGGDTLVELELVEGGRYDTHTTGPPELVEAIRAEFPDKGDDALISHDTVLRVEAPLLFEHTFGGDPGSIARWKLQRDGDGCRLTLTHTEPPGFAAKDAPRDLGGWHALLDLLALNLDGRSVPWTKDRWEEHRDRYAAKGV
jgi:uncharacterized protein YndB with AHSA1/START domain